MLEAISVRPRPARKRVLAAGSNSGGERQVPEASEQVATTNQAESLAAPNQPQPPRPAGPTATAATPAPPDRKATSTLPNYLHGPGGASRAGQRAGQHAAASGVLASAVDAASSAGANTPEIHPSLSTQTPSEPALQESSPPPVTARSSGSGGGIGAIGRNIPGAQQGATNTPEMALASQNRSQAPPPAPPPAPQDSGNVPVTSAQPQAETPAPARDATPAQEAEAQTEEKMEAAEPETGPGDTSDEDNTATPIQAGATAGAPAAGDVSDAAASSDEAETQAAETDGSDVDDGGAEAAAVGDVAPAAPQAQAATDGAAAGGMQSQTSADAAAPDGSVPDAQALQRGQAQAEQNQEQHDNERISQQASTQREEEQAEQDAQSGNAPAGAQAELSGPEKAAALDSVGEEQPAEAGPRGGAGGGGAGGSGAETKTDKAPPDVSAMPPEQGLATLASATPAQADAALGGVQAAAASHQQRQTQATQESLPQTTVGEPSSPRVTGGRGGGAGGVAGASAVAPVSAAQASKTEIAPTPEPPAGNAADKVARPNIATPAQGAEPSAADKAQVAASISALPTSDPGLRTTLGSAPTLQLSGAADPAQLAARKERSGQAMAAARVRDAAEVAKPMGEQNVRPTVGQARIRARTLKAAAAGAARAAGAAGGAGAGAGGAGAGAVGGARGVLAEELKGPEVRAAMLAASARAATARVETQARIAAGNASAQAQVGDIKNQAANDQDRARAKVRSDARQARSQYARKQEAAIGKLEREQQQTIARTTDKAGEEKRKGEEDAAAQIAQGETQTADKAREVEAAVTRKKQEVKAKSEEKGFFGRLADSLGAWFDRQKQWISDKVEAGKKWIKDTADRFKKYAGEKIDQARDRVMGLIQAGGERLKSGADALLSEFPAARDAVKGAIDSAVEVGINATNAIAQAAKNGVNKAVDAAAAVAEGALDLGGKAVNAAMDAAKATTVGALNAADKAMAALGVLKILVEDVASDPLGWIGKLAASAKDGVVNHLAAAMKAAIKQWWEGKLESVLGIGPAIWAVLKQGGLALQDIGAMAWAAIKAAIPPALIQLIVEKVVAMIVPAAGAVIAIIEGLQAAWGSVSAMLGAIGKAIAYLKAVKVGAAAARFAQLVAAAAVVVIDFLSNWLIARLGKAIMKIGGKIKGIAQKLLRKISGSVKKFKTGRKARKKRNNKAARDRKARQLRAQRKHRVADKDGRKKDDPNKKKQDKKDANAARLRKAVEAIRPRIMGLAGKGAFKGLVLRAKLLGWRVRYRLSSLQLIKSGKTVSVRATINPTQNVIENWVVTNLAELRQMIHDIAAELMGRPEAQAMFDSIKGREKPIPGMEPAFRKPSKADPIKVADEGFDGAGQALALAARQRGTNPHAPHFDPGTPNHAPARGSSVALQPVSGDDPVRITQGGTRGAAGRPGSALFRDAMDEGKSYPEFVSEARRLKGQGVSDQQMAAQAVQILRGEAPGGPQASRGLAASAAVMVGVEGGRSDRALVMMPEMLRTVAEGRNLAHLEGAPPGGVPMTMKDALETHNPVSAVGAAKALHATDKASGPTQKNYRSDRLSKRQRRAGAQITQADINYFAHVTALQIGGPGGLVGKSDAQIKSMLKQKNLLDALRTFMLQRAEHAHGLDRHPESGDPREEGAA